MKKKIGLVALLVASAGALSLASCDDSKTTQNTESIKKQDSEINKMQVSLADLETKIADVNTSLSSTIQSEVAKINAKITEVDQAIDTKVSTATAALKTELEAADTETNEAIAGLKTSLEAKDAEISTTIANLKAALEDEDSELAQAIAALEANDEDTATTIANLKTALENADAEISTTIANLKTSLEAEDTDLASAIAALEAADEEFATTIANLKTNLEGQIANLAEQINQASVTQQELDAAVEALESADEEINSTIDGINTSITSINNEITTIKGTLTAYNTRITTLETSVGVLQNTDETISAKIAAIQTAITALQTEDETLAGLITDLESAAATKESLETNVSALEAADTELNNLIADLTNQFTTAKTAFEESISKNATDIETINGQIEEITGILVEHTQNISDILHAIDDDVVSISEQFDDFYGDEVKQLKADYIYGLSQIYADFVDELSEVKDQLLAMYVQGGQDTSSIITLYDNLYSTSNHEMIGYLYKGIAYVTLAKDTDEAEAAYKEYSDKLESFINEARFTVNKETVRQTIDKLTYIPSTTQEAILTALNAVNYDTQDTLEMSADEVEEYYKIRVRKISVYQSWASAIDEVYKYRNTINLSLDELAKENEIDITGLSDAEIEEFKESVLEIINLDDYFEIGSDIIEAIDSLADTTPLEVVTEITKKYKDDEALMDVIEAQAKAYYDITKYHSDIFDAYDLLENLKDSEMNSFKTTVAEYHVKSSYDALETKEAVAAKKASDLANMKIYLYEAQNYDAGRAYDIAKKSVISGLLNIQDYEITGINDLITQSVKFNEYYVLVTADNAFANTDAIAAKLATDKSRIDLLTYQAQQYDAARKYDVDNEAIVAALDTITVPEKSSINNLIKGTVTYDAYIDAIATNALVDTKLADDKTAIDLLVYKAQNYNATRKHEIADEATVTALDTITADEKTAINTLIKNKVTYDNYITVATSKSAVDLQVGDDIYVVDLYTTEATNYNAARKYDLANEDVVSTYVKIPATEITTINGILNNIVQYDNYISTEITAAQSATQLTNDKAAIDLYVHKAYDYNEAKAYVETNQGTVSALTDIADDQDAINALIAGVVQYDNYITTPTTAVEVDTQLANDKLAIDLLVYKAEKYNDITGNAIFSKEAVDDLGKLTADEKEDTCDYIDGTFGYDDYIITPQSKTAVDNRFSDDCDQIQLYYLQANAYNELRVFEENQQNIVSDFEYISNADKASINETIDDIVDYYGNYLDWTEDEDETDDQLSADKAAILLYVYKATQYNAANNYVSTNQGTIDELANLTSTEKTSIKGLIANVVEYNNYINVLNDELATDDQLSADKAAIDLLVNQAQGYNDAIQYAKDRYAFIDANFNELTSGELSQKAYVESTLLDVAKYANYIGVTLSSDETATQLATDKAAINLYEAQAKAYNDICIYEYGRETAVVLLDIGTDETNTTNDALEALPQFVDYFEALADYDAIIAKYSLDKAQADLYYYQATQYKALLNYVISTQDDIEDVDNTSTEYTTVIGLLEAIPDYSNYFDYEKAAVDAQLLADEASADLLLTRITNYKDICDLIEANDATIAAYEATTGEFTDADKESFMGLYVDKKNSTSYDAIVEDFETEDYATYYTTVKNEIELISNSAAKIFNDLIGLIENAKNQINATTTLTDEYKEAYINRIKDYDVYANYIAATENFTTAAEYNAYYQSIKTLVDDTNSIRGYENSLITEMNDKITAINNAFNTEGITEEEKNYLLAVIESIYNDCTNLEVTSTNAAQANVTNATTRLNNVYNAVTTFSNVDSGIKNLNTSLATYVSNAKDEFLTSFNEPVYHNAMDVWEDHKDEINAKADECKYEYTIPTETDYATFTTFTQGLLLKTVIEARINGLIQWYETDDDNDDDGNPDGMLYQLIDEYQALEAADLPEAKADYIADLQEAYNEYLSYDGTDTTKPNYTSYKNQLKLAFNTWKSAINNSTSTGAVVANYESGLAALDNVVIGACRQFYLDKLDAYATTLIAGTDDQTKKDALAAAAEDWSGEINGAIPTSAVAQKYAAAITALNLIAAQ